MTVKIIKYNKVFNHRFIDKIKLSAKKQDAKAIIIKRIDRKSVV